MSLKQKVSAVINLTDELMLNIPIISITGNTEFIIENYKGIVLYSENKIKINTTIGVVSVIGDDLELSKVASEKIKITGKISDVSFLGI